MSIFRFLFSKLMKGNMTSLDYRTILGTGFKNKEVKEHDKTKIDVSPIDFNRDK